MQSSGADVNDSSGSAQRALNHVIMKPRVSLLRTNCIGMVWKWKKISSTYLADNTRRTYVKARRIISLIAHFPLLTGFELKKIVENYVKNTKREISIDQISEGVVLICDGCRTLG
jgi:chromosomal replication initiator protein